jgi:hypothetical protein
MQRVSLGLERPRRQVLQREQSLSQQRAPLCKEARVLHFVAFCLVRPQFGVRRKLLGLRKLKKVERPVVLLAEYCAQDGSGLALPLLDVGMVKRKLSDLLDALDLLLKQGHRFLAANVRVSRSRLLSCRNFAPSFAICRKRHEVYGVVAVAA